MVEENMTALENGVQVRKAGGGGFDVLFLFLGDAVQETYAI